MVVGFIAMLFGPIFAFAGDTPFFDHAAAYCLVGGALLFLIGWGLDWLSDGN